MPTDSKGRFAAMIPASLRQKVLRVFGPPAQQWLGNLPYLVATCVEKWGLYDYEPSPVMSHNLVCFSRSAQFGDVVLKIGFPHRELYTEQKALATFKGHKICQIFAWDQSLGAMLLQRLFPGHDLTAVSEKSQSIKEAASLAASLPLPIGPNDEFPSFFELMDSALKNQRQHGNYPEMLQYVESARQTLNKLAAGRPEALLHGDLNHWNILNHNGQWMAIDPKGITGPACMEPARFMQNELKMSGVQSLEEMATTIGAAIGESASVATEAVFVDTVLATCWSMEEHIQKDRSKDLDLCRFLHQNTR